MKNQLMIALLGLSFFVGTAQAVAYDEEDRYVNVLILSEEPSRFVQLPWQEGDRVRDVKNAFGIGENQEDVRVWYPFGDIADGVHTYPDGHIITEDQTSERLAVMPDDIIFIIATRAQLDRYIAQRFGANNRN